MLSTKEIIEFVDTLDTKSFLGSFEEAKTVQDVIDLITGSYEDLLIGISKESKKTNKNKIKISKLLLTSFSRLPSAVMSSEVLI